MPTRVVHPSGARDDWPAWTFDARAERWSEDEDSNRPPDLWFAFGGSGTASAWDEAARRTLFVSGRARSDMAGVTAYDATRHTWETLWNGTPCLDSTVTYDAINGRLVCMADASPEGIDDTADATRGMAAFDAVTRRWITLLEPVTSNGSPAGSLPPEP